MRGCSASGGAEEGQKIGHKYTSTRISNLLNLNALLLSLEFMDWHLQWKKWFLIDISATVGQILMISSADPHEILVLIKW